MTGSSVSLTQSRSNDKPHEWLGSGQNGRTAVIGTSVGSLGELCSLFVYRPYIRNPKPNTRTLHILFNHVETDEGGYVFDCLPKIAEGRTAMNPVFVGMDMTKEFSGVN